MFQSSSPVSSPARSMAAKEHSGEDDVQLTPRSKVKALLAGLDDSEDDDLAQVAPRRARVAEALPLKTRPTEPGHTSVESSDDEEEEDTVIAPRGRLAARLQSNNQPFTEEDTNLYLHPATNATDEPPVQGSDDEQSQDEERPVAVRKGLGNFLKRKRPEIQPEQGSPREETTGGSPHTLEDNRLGQSAEEANDSASEPEVPTATNRFAALVEKKRAERVAREAAEAAKKAEKTAARKKASHDTQVSEIDSIDEDSETEVRLTQKSRPARKAGKKAMEEMARETQRISRNMQLAHEALTKKKVTKESLLARFKPKPAISHTVVPASSSTLNSSAQNSENEDGSAKQTPLTSPDRSISKSKNVPILIPETSRLQEDSDDELPTLEEVLAEKVDKGKGKAVDASYEDVHPEIEPFKPATNMTVLPVELPMPSMEKQRRELNQRPIRVRLPQNPVRSANLGDLSDDELEVVNSKVFKLFDNLPAKKNAEGRSALVQRALAQISVAPKKTTKDSGAVNSQDVIISLRRQARQQAAAERAEKIAVLRSKGVVIRTAEEVQKDQIAVEDLLAKARQEEAELTKREKEESKNEKRANGEEVDDSSEDEDYNNDEDEGDGEQDVDLSGSEDDNGTEDEDVSDAESADNLIDDAAAESEDEASDEEIASVAGETTLALADTQLLDEEEDVPAPRRQRRNKPVILDEDDEEEKQLQSTDIIPTTATESPGAVQNPFGQRFGAAAAPMGLTQAFAATMANSQSQQDFTQQDSLLQLQSMPSPNFPNLIPDSLQAETQQASLGALDLDLHLTQTQIEHDTLPVNFNRAMTQLSEMPDPTQDAGFQQSSPPPARFATAPESTIDTVIVPQASPMPTIKKRGRLVKQARRGIATFSDEEDDAAVNDAQIPESDLEADEADETAFNVMKKAAEKAKRKQARFDKGKSEAKGMFEEQAQESEDEYAGLGGNSDDSEGEEDEEIRKMIDEGEVDVNERKVAAYFAEKAREEDEAGISKLYKDINSGALRRKRGVGADFDDLDDSDDDHQARQARKRREFARMRKALLDGDSNIVKIAEDPKKMAFLRAIEDRDDEDDMGLLDSTPRDDNDTQEDSQDIIPDSQAENIPPGMMKRKRDIQDSMLPPAKKITTTNSRRSVLGPAKKPATLADIRDSLSFLIEEPDSQFDSRVGPSIFDASSDVELDIEEEEVDIPEDAIGAPDDNQHKNPRRTGPRANKPEFVDRLSLKRQESSKNSQSNTGAMAFMDPKFSSDRPTFKPPTLLRKATSSFSSFSAQDEHGISTNNNAKKASEPVVKGRGVGGGSKRSSVNWAARDAERKAAREKRLEKSGAITGTTGIKRQGSGLSNLLAGKSAWE